MTRVPFTLIAAVLLGELVARDHLKRKLTEARAESFIAGWNACAGTQGPQAHMPVPAWLRQVANAEAGLQ